MSQSLNTLLKLSALGLSMGVLVGCAAQGNQEELRQMVNEANENSEEALASADEAWTKSDNAIGTARSAEQMASRNSDRIEELNEKIDRMFEESMQK